MRTKKGTMENTSIVYIETTACLKIKMCNLHYCAMCKIMFVLNFIDKWYFIVYKYI